MKRYCTAILLTVLMAMEALAQVTIETRLVVTQNEGTNGGSFRVAIQAKGTNLTAANTIGSGTVDISFDNTKLSPVLVAGNNVQATYDPTLSGYAFRSITYIPASSYIRLSIAGLNINSNFDGTPAGLDLTSSYVTLATANFTILDNTAITTVSISSSTLTIGLFQSHNNEDGAFVINPQTMNTPVDLVSQPLPVELQSFTAKAVRGGVELAWSTATEVNNAGFEVQKRTSGAWASIGFVAGAGTSNAPKQYAYAEKNVGTGAYAYRLKQIDRDGGAQYSKAIEVNIAAPKQYALMQNFPNPFNPATRITYDIAEAGAVRLTVFDLLGREVMELVNETKEPGAYVAELNAARLPSGLYFYRLEAGRFSAVKKLTVMK